MAEDLPVFDDQWVANARHHELSVNELKRIRRSHQRANRRRKARRVILGVVAVGVLAGIVVYVARTPGNAVDTSGFELLNDTNRVWLNQVAGEHPTPVAGGDLSLIHI